MKNIIIHLIWAIALSSAIGALSYTTLEYNINHEKDTSFMMKACVEAGGSWERSGWSTFYECKRQK